MRKTAFIMILGLLCSGCVWPRYHETETYNINVEEVLPGAFGTYTQRQDYSYKPDTTITVNGMTSNTRGYVAVPRHLDNPKLVISKPGFEPYTIPLKKQFTDEKWAQYFLNEGMTEHPLSAAYLPFFPNTWALPTIKSNQKYTSQDIPAIALGWLVTLPFNLAVDVYNLVIGWPLTPVLNPWYNFTYNPTLGILTPTKQMQQVCHAKSNHLIANSGCESCGATDVLYTSQSECASCHYREYNQQSKTCKLDWVRYCRNVLKPQHSPKKMGQFLSKLTFQQIWTGEHFKNISVNSNKYITIAALIKDCGVDVYETDSDGRSLVFYLPPGYWEYVNPKWSAYKNPPPMRDKYGMTARQYYDQQHKSR